MFSRGDDEEEPEEMAKRYGQAIGSYYAGQWVGVRELSTFIKYGQTFETPMQSSILAAPRALTEFADLALDEDAEFDRGSLRAVTDLVPVLGFPTGAQLNRTIGYMMEVEEKGGEFDLYDALVTGKYDDE